MKKTLFLSMLVFCVLLTYAQNTITVKHTYYTMLYDTAHKAELIGYYIQTKDHALASINKVGTIDRKLVGVFKDDPLLPTYIQDLITNDVYSDWNKAHKNQKVDKGHLVPYSAMDFDLTAALESMYMGNVCPQAPRFNEHQWEQVEMYVLKTVAPQYGDVKVWTGVLINDKTALRVGPLYMPDYYWKVISYVKDGKTVQEAWLGLNNWSNADTDPTHIATTVDKVKQKIAQYYPKLKTDF